MPIANPGPQTTAKGVTAFDMRGRRWWQRSAGNTYHSVELFGLINGQWESLGKVPYAHGSELEYSQSGIDWLIDNGYLVAPHPLRVSGLYTRYKSEYREANCITRDVVDVKRKRDL